MRFYTCILCNLNILLKENILIKRLLNVGIVYALFLGILEKLLGILHEIRASVFYSLRISNLIF